MSLVPRYVSPTPTNPERYYYDDPARPGGEGRGGEGWWRRGFWSVPIIVARTLAIFRGFFASSTTWHHVPSSPFPHLYSQQAAVLITALLTYNGTIGEDLATVLQYLLAILGIYLPLHKTIAKRLTRFKACCRVSVLTAELEI